MSTAIVLFVVLIICLALSLPVGFALLFSSIVTIFIMDIHLPFDTITKTMITANDSFPLMAIPFFILAGALMGKGGVSKRLFDIANNFFGHIRGGVAISTVITSMFFAAISGSGPATVAAIGTVMIPEMVKQGYSKPFSTALIAASGTIGIVIPPSIPLIIFGVTANVSVGKLFLAGVLPGIMMGLSLILWAYVHARRKNYPTAEKSSWKCRLKSLNNGKAALLMPVIILGGIYGGVFTPTEAAAVAVVYGFVISVFIYKEIKVYDFFEIFYDSAVTTGSVMIIVATAGVLGRILTLERIPVEIANSILSISSSVHLFILLVIIILLVMGMFMETIASLLILTPIIFPLAMELNVDPIHLGIIMIVGLSLGFVTPPLGLNLFVASSISKVKVETLSRYVMPGFLNMVVTLILISYISWFSLVFIFD